MLSDVSLECILSYPTEKDQIIALLIKLYGEYSVYIQHRSDSILHNYDNLNMHVSKYWTVYG